MVQGDCSPTDVIPDHVKTNRLGQPTHGHRESVTTITTNDPLGPCRVYEVYIGLMWGLPTGSFHGNDLLFTILPLYVFDHKDLSTHMFVGDKASGSPPFSGSGSVLSEDDGGVMVHSKTVIYPPAK